MTSKLFYSSWMPDLESLSIGHGQVQCCKQWAPAARAQFDASAIKRYCSKTNIAVTWKFRAGWMSTWNNIQRARHASQIYTTWFLGFASWGLFSRSLTISQNLAEVWFSARDRFIFTQSRRHSASQLSLIDWFDYGADGLVTTTFVQNIYCPQNKS